MKIPRDIGGADFAKALGQYGYKITRQTGSHLRLTTQLKGEHHLTIPAHVSLRVGTISAVLSDVASHFHREKQDIAKELWG